MLSDVITEVWSYLLPTLKSLPTPHPPPHQIPELYFSLSISEEIINY